MGLRVYAAVMAAAVGVSGVGIVIVGCSGGSSGGGFVPPPPAFTPDPADPPQRLETLNGTSAPLAPLNDNKIHVFEFPVQPGVTFAIDIDTQPSGQQLRVQIDEFNVTTGQRLNLFNGSVAGGDAAVTPFSTDVTATTTGKIQIQVADEFQAAAITLTRVAARQTSPTFNPTSFQVVVHFAGDSFPTYGQGYNDLANDTDRGQFTNDLLNRMNTVLAGTGVQIDVGNSGFRTIPTATISNMEPGLLDGNGVSILDGGAASGSAADPRRWGSFGIDANDTSFGNALDIVIVDTSLDIDPGPELKVLKGTSTGDVRTTSGGLVRIGGILRGNGLSHCVVVPLFVETGPTTIATLPFTEVATNAVHETGHFLGLHHVTERGTSPVLGSQNGLGFWQLQRYAGTPPSTLADDKNGNGVLDVIDDAPLPDDANVMFVEPDAANNEWGSGQIAALRAYLALMEH